MANTYSSGTQSRAAIKGHPLHPMIVPFPIAAFVGALLTDLVFLGTSDPFWARASLWLIGAGVVMGAVAGILGYMDFRNVPRVRQHRIAWVHALGNSAILVLAIINWSLRMYDPIAGVVPWGAALSAVAVLGLMFTGWYGGELVYRHRIGMVSGPPDGEPRTRQ